MTARRVPMLSLGFVTCARRLRPMSVALLQLHGETWSAKRARLTESIRLVARTGSR